MHATPCCITLLTAVAIQLISCFGSEPRMILATSAKKSISRTLTVADTVSAQNVCNGLWSPALFTSQLMQPLHHGRPVRLMHFFVSSIA
jgi:hypothetical protein